VLTVHTVNVYAPTECFSVKGNFAYPDRRSLLPQELLIIKETNAFMR